jgi:hypothetical protein
LHQRPPLSKQPCQRTITRSTINHQFCHTGNIHADQNKTLKIGKKKYNKHITIKITIKTEGVRHCVD